MTDSKTARRGYVPDDKNNFSPESIDKLRVASRHVLYLINEGYDLKQATVFVGNHFLLSERQRLAVMRSLATSEQLEARKAKLLKDDESTGKDVWIDGFNTVITLEVLMSDSILFSCMDGTVRDLASLRGTYRIIPETESAVRLLFDALANMKIRSATVLLDEPISNSGRLKALMAELAENYPFDLNIQIQKDVDRTLYRKESVISSDSVILDRCLSWINLTAACMERQNRKGLCVGE